jgi:hypothetical protein
LHINSTLFWQLEEMVALGRRIPKRTIGFLLADQTVSEPAGGLDAERGF